MEEPDEEGWVTVTKTQKFNKVSQMRNQGCHCIFSYIIPNLSEGRRSSMVTH